LDAGADPLAAQLKYGSPFEPYMINALAMDLENSHYFFYPFVEIRVIRGKDNFSKSRKLKRIPENRDAGVRPHPCFRACLLIL
jgi:hypothetical protein